MNAAPHLRHDGAVAAGERVPERTRVPAEAIAPHPLAPRPVAALSAPRTRAPLSSLRRDTGSVMRESLIFPVFEISNKVRCFAATLTARSMAGQPLRGRADTPQRSVRPMETAVAGDDRGGTGRWAASGGGVRWAVAAGGRRAASRWYATAGGTRQPVVRDSRWGAVSGWRRSGRGRGSTRGSPAPLGPPARRRGLRWPGRARRRRGRRSPWPRRRRCTRRAGRP